MHVQLSYEDHSQLIWKSATELSNLIQERLISSEEVVSAYYDQIERVNPYINVIVSLTPREEALKMAREADRKTARGELLGPLHGLPTAVKDLIDVEGHPTKFGSVAFKDAPIAKRDALMVSRLREAGAIVVGKTATAEFGVGTLTFSALQGITRNPFDLSRHAGGSTGSAAAVAGGLLPFADGSDSGGSLRYPAAFCNVVGMRTSPGRIPSDGSGSGWSPHSVLGPMAKSSRDAQLILSAVAGESDVSPIALEGGCPDASTLEPRELSGLRIAWSADAGGLPIDPVIRRAHESVRMRLEELGCQIDVIEPDFTDVDWCWETIEMFGFFSKGWRHVKGNEALFRGDYVRNILQGKRTSAEDLAHALEKRTDIYRRTAWFMREYDLFITPATPVEAPGAELEWVDQIEGAQFERYLEWQRLACRLTMTAHPVLVTPGGLTENGLPFGIQIMGHAGKDWKLLRLTSLIEQALGETGRRPETIELIYGGATQAV